MVKSELEVQALGDLEQEIDLGAMDQRSLHVAVVQRLVVAECAADPHDFPCERHRHRIQGGQIARHRPGIAAPCDMTARGGHGTQRPHPRTPEFRIHVFHSHVEAQRLPARTPVQFIDHRTEISGTRIRIPRQGKPPFPLELLGKVILRAGLQQSKAAAAFRHQAELVGRSPEGQLVSRREGPQQQEG